MIKPFQNETESLGISDLTIENRSDRVEIYGAVHITRDKQGLAHARALKALVDEVVAALEGSEDLPEKVPAPKKPGTMKNPFLRG